MIVTPVGIDEPVSANIHVYAVEDIVYIKSTEIIREVNVYNILGQVVVSKSAKGGLLDAIYIPGPDAMYVVKLITTKGVFSRRVFVAGNYE
jgi:hypothetical protein